MNIDGRLEKTVGTVEITIEEYFELRSKAESNMFLMSELGRYESRFVDLESRMHELEKEMRRVVARCD